MTPIEKMRLTRKLNEVHAALEGEKSPLQRLRLAKEKLEIRAKLQGSAPVPAPEPTPVPTPEPKPDTSLVAQEGAKPHLDELLAVAQGQHDAEGLQALYDRINKAVRALDDGGYLSGVGVEVSNEAITHWAKLEIKTNG